MPVKTYVPGLIRILRAAHFYMTRYQSTLANTISAPAYACLQDSIAAVASCLALIDAPETGE